MSRLKCARQAGFTLLEVVVAAAVLGVGMAVAIQLFSNGLGNMRRVDMAHQAMSYAESIMGDLLSDDTIRGPYRVSGDLDDNFEYRAFVDYWTPPSTGGQLVDPESENKISLLSLKVEVEFKNSKYARVYRAFSLKAVSQEFQSQDDLINPLGDAVQR